MNAQDLDQKLADRKILGMAKVYGWEHFLRTRIGWAIPYYTEDGEKIVLPRKFKAGDGKSPKGFLIKKDKNDPNEKFDFPYYAPPGSIAKIKETSEVWLAEGEPDVLVLHTLGIQNAICWANGAGSIPPTLIDDLKRWGVYRVNYIPDLDTAGYGSGIKLHKLLEGQGFSLTIRRVEGELGSKGDLNDMLIKGTFDPKRLARWSIEDLQALLPKAEPKPFRNPSTPAPKHDDELNPRVADALYDYAMAIGGKIEMVTGQRTIPLYSFKGGHKSDILGEHARYYPDTQSAFDWSIGDHGAWYGAKDLVALWRIDVETIGGWYVKPPKQPTNMTAQQPPSVLPPSDLFTTQRAVMGDLLDYLANPEKLRNLAILRNPFPHLRQFGGFAKVLTEGMVMLVLGTTGGKKSTLIDNMIDNLLDMEYTGVLVGGEWTPDLHGMKAVQRHSGVSLDDLLEDMIARAALAQGLDGVEMDCKVLSEEQRQAAIRATRKLSKTKGDLIHFNAKYSQYSFSTILENVAREIVLQRATGKKVSWVAVDYAQFYTDDDTYRGQNIPEHILTSFKLFCVNMRVVGFMTSQITKVAQKDVEKGEKISIADGLGLRADKANLVVTIENVEAGGKQLPYKKITVSKNSGGGTDYFYLNDAPEGNHFLFKLDGSGIADRMIVDAQIYEAKTLDFTKPVRPDKKAVQS